MPVIKRHQTLIDYVVAEAGTVSALFDVALKNGIGITEELTGGTVLEVDKKKYKDEPVQLKQKQIEEIVADQVITRRQTFLDFVTQQSGTVEGLFEMALLNGISPTDIIAPGELLKVRVIDVDVNSFFNRSISDVISNINLEETLPGGIGYMKIESSFKVS